MSLLYEIAQEYEFGTPYILREFDITAEGDFAGQQLTPTIKQHSNHNR